MQWIERIRGCFEGDRVYYTNHAKVEMETEEFGPILDSEIYEAICAGEVIEEYPDDAPYPSVLVFGLTGVGRPLHVVCAYNGEEERTIVVTAYQPDPERWVDYRKRRPR